MTARTDPAAIEELVGAYALDACSPEEAAEVESLLERRPDLAEEASQLSRAAAWIGATEALTAPEELRSSLATAVQARRSPEATDEPTRCYRASTARLDETIGALEEHDFDVTTPNALTARELVVHLAAQESALARAVGAPATSDAAGDGIESNTAAFIERYADAPLDEVRGVWRRSVDAVAAWAAETPSTDAEVAWLGLRFTRDDMLVVRAFESWIHRDDLRRVGARSLDPPPADELHAMSDFSARMLPVALKLSDRVQPGKLARLMLTGPGGGEWLVPMGGDVEPARAPDVTLTADAVDWCRVFGERIEPMALERQVEGDESLADDLLASAPALAML